jgi:hypothetical protein
MTMGMDPLEARAPVLEELLHVILTWVQRVRPSFAKWTHSTLFWHGCQAGSSAFTGARHPFARCTCAGDSSFSYGSTIGVRLRKCLRLPFGLFGNRSSSVSADASFAQSRHKRFLRTGTDLWAYTSRSDADANCIIVFAAVHGRSSSEKSMQLQRARCERDYEICGVLHVQLSSIVQHQENAVVPMRQYKIVKP